MIKEAYCNCEISELLKEKGFDEKVFTYYEDKVLKYGLWFEWNRSPLGHIAAPTHQMACAWLREAHKLYIVVRPYVTEEGFFSLFDVKSVKEKEIVVNLRTKTGFNTYEEACEAAIKYSLENLI